ncbi:MAG: hypothetical protein ACK55Z_15520, partial [bacterium]
MVMSQTRRTALHQKQTAFTPHTCRRNKCRFAASDVITCPSLATSKLLSPGTLPGRAECQCTAANKVSPASTAFLTTRVTAAVTSPTTRASLALARSPSPSIL